jgi:hypothetical protein
MKISKWTQANLNFARELEIKTPEELDYRTKLATGMTDEEKKIEYLKWYDSLEEKEKKDFDRIFNCG